MTFSVLAILGDFSPYNALSSSWKITLKDTYLNLLKFNQSLLILMLLEIQETNVALDFARAFVFLCVVLSQDFTGLNQCAKRFWKLNCLFLHFCEVYQYVGQEITVRILFNF